MGKILPMSFQSTALKSPPRAQMAFRVGIVGHRPDRLPKDQATLDRLQQMLRYVLQTVKAEVSGIAGETTDGAKPFYAVDPPILRAISPLAEGADRMFAEEAIKLGYELLCPMPFHQDEFEKDFVPPQALEKNSLVRFRELLKRAHEGAGVTTFELDGERSAAGEAYAMAGRIVLNQSDLLIAVWDRGKPAGSGGTVQTLHEAVRYRVPVLLIDAMRPHDWTLLNTDEDIRRLEQENRHETGDSDLTEEQAASHFGTKIRNIVAAELAPPTSRADQNRITKLDASDYFGESNIPANRWFVGKMLISLIGSGELRLPKISLTDFETEISEQWPVRPEKPTEPRSCPSSDDTDNAPSAVEDWVNRRLRPHYAWADQLADLYADRYRSGYILVYFLSAFAVLIGLLLPFDSFGAIIASAVEAILVFLIIRLVRQGNKQHWHERWMEYRLLAELIRQARILIPLGGGRPLPRTPSHTGAYGNLTQTWMYWHVRALARATGIPQVKVTREYLLDCLRYMEKLIGPTDDGQLNFHILTAKRSTSASAFLDSMSRNLFVVALCFVLIQFVSLIFIRFLPLVVTQDSVAHNLIDRFILVFAMLPALAALCFCLVAGSGGMFLVLAALPAIGAVLAWYFSGSPLDIFLPLAAIPAFGAAFAGIANQGEYARLAKRSIAMAGAFEQFLARINSLRSTINSTRVTRQFSNTVVLATDITQLMVDEVSDWRVLVAERPMRVS